ncbi:PEP-CTERM system histidine kinase PrsK [Alishewanella sp. 16-MA]|uniref:histidine kinase n=1 Tax=Alishewanella maricola TaxID=2795740 RepID=A0ABS8C301_9ALTE|nr:PEP-CTERM system histidine kinase PrsK [Alishewanella maricola]
MIDISAEQLGFGIAAISYFIFALLILTTKSNSVQRGLLFAFSVVSVVWAGYYAWSLQLPYVNSGSYLVENSRNLLLSLFLLAALKHHGDWQNFFLNKSVIATLLGFVLWTAVGLNHWMSQHLIYVGNLLIAILQLAILEAIYRKTNVQQRWQFKPLLIALAVCILFDFVLLAESALFARIDSHLWQARGFIFTLMIPFLVIAIRRIEAWGINVYISRDIVLQSTLVMAAGVYLLLLAITGFYLRYIGGSWSELLQTSFIVLGFALMLLLVLSGTIRRRLKVFIEKHFFANSFDYREKWLALTSGLKQIDISHVDRHHKILQVWLQSINYGKGAIVQYRPQGELKILALHGRAPLTEAEVTLLQRYQSQYANQNWQIDLTEPQGALTADLAKDQLKLQLLLPIRTKAGLWGVCIMQAGNEQKLQLNWELRDYLSVVSEQIATLLLLMQHSDKLSENAQFIAFSRMSAFVVHDLKNVKAQLDLTLRNAQKHRHNPEFIDDTFSTLESMQQRLDNMLLQLTTKQSNERPQRSFSVAEIISQVIEQRCAVKSPQPELIVRQDCQLMLDQHRFANVMFHLLDNAQHATPSTGSIKVYMQTTSTDLLLNICDTGCGMSADFIEHRLFKPFDTTKGNAGMGIGVYDAQVFIEQAGGSIKVSSTIGEGTTFSIHLPLQSEVDEEETTYLSAQGTL